MYRNKDENIKLNKSDKQTNNTKFSVTALCNNEETEYKTLKGRTLTWADNYLFYLCMNVYFKIVPYLIQTSTPPTTTTTTTSRRPTTTSWIVNNVVIPFLTSALSGLHASR